jgi:uncharacterized protein YbjQ (UPF0145 family)
VAVVGDADGQNATETVDHQEALQQLVFVRGRYYMILRVRNCAIVRVRVRVQKRSKACESECAHARAKSVQKLAKVRVRVRKRKDRQG